MDKKLIRPAKVNNGKRVHWVIDRWTLCESNNRNSPAHFVSEVVTCPTCKRLIKPYEGNPDYLIARTGYEPNC